MVQEGSCTLSTDEAGYVLDRLAGLQQVISDEAIRQALADTGRVQKRLCRLTLEVTLWIVLAMGVLTDLPIRQVFKQARRMRCGEKSSDRSSLCVARQRLGVAPVRALFESTVHPLARPDTIGGFYKGLRLVGIDGAYHERWEEELTYDEQKTHQDPRRATKPAHLRSQTPAGVIQELYALSLAHFVIRALMFEAAESVHLDPERLSFTGCFQILKCRLPECVTHTPETFQTWYDNLLWEMQQELLPPRRNRINPRVIKQKIRKWPKKQPHHRPAPKLSKTFEESVLIH
jgi:hypothetical protein